MSTPAQVLANRQNSLHSTGPKTDAGKAASSRNSVSLRIPGDVDNHSELMSITIPD